MLHKKTSNKRVVLLGGGHSHALVLQALAQDPLIDVELTVIDPTPAPAYSGMFPGVIAGHYPPEAMHYDLRQLSQKARGHYLQAAAKGIDRQAQRIILLDGEEVPYDILSIDIGLHSRMDDIKGFDINGVAVKPFAPMAQEWLQFRARCETGAQAPHVAIIGAGVAGTELALAMHHALSHLPDCSISVIDRSQSFAGSAPRLRRLVMKALKAAEVQIFENAKIAQITDRHVALADGQSVPAQFCLAAATSKAHAWVAETGLVTQRGFIEVDAFLRSSDPNIFAAGDCAELGFAPRPKAGVYAVRAAPRLERSLRAAVQGAPLDQSPGFAPQKDFLKLISLGGKKAIATKAGFAISGNWVWRWKDRIDREFMHKLQ